MAGARTRSRETPHALNSVDQGRKPVIGRFKRENEAAGDRAGARSQAMKMESSRQYSASRPGTETMASEVLGFTDECGHAMERTNGGLKKSNF